MSEMGILRRESLVFACLSLLLIFAGWAMGGNLLWAVWGLLILAVLSFLALFVPLEADRWHGNAKYTPLENLRALGRFPVFWLGIPLLLWIAASALNPAWVWQWNGIQWGVEALPGFLEWLPASVDAPLGFMNAWRVGLYLSAAWLAVLALHIGITSRANLFRLLHVTMVNAALVALFGTALNISGASDILGLYEPGNKEFFGTWISPNQGAAFLYLNAAITLGLMVRSFDRNGLRSGKFFVYVLLFLVLEVGIFVAGSRYGIFAGAGLLGLGLLLLLAAGHRWRSPLVLLPVLVVGAFGVVAVSWVWQLSKTPNLAQMYEETRQQFSQDNEDLRVITAKGNLQMLQLRPWRGLGPGSYRYFVYAVRERYADDQGLEGKVRQRFLDSMPYYAHCDWIQYPIEFGALGTLPLALMLLYWHVRRLRLRGGFRLWMLSISAGLLLLYAHALIDFPLSSPSILIVYGIVLAASTQLLQLNQKGAEA